jgi:hypothetical protein
MPYAPKQLMAPASGCPVYAWAAGCEQTEPFLADHQWQVGSACLARHYYGPRHRGMKAAVVRIHTWHVKMVLKPLVRMQRPRVKQSNLITCYCVRNAISILPLDDGANGDDG